MFRTKVARIEGSGHFVRRFKGAEFILVLKLTDPKKINIQRLFDDPRVMAALPLQVIGFGRVVAW